MKLFLDLSIDNEPFWDLCCDHGYVGIGALESGRFSEVNFVDQVSHIIERLEILLNQHFLGTKVDQYHCYAIDAMKIEKELFGTILIAGVGGLTISNILEQLFESKKLKAKRLILSPHTDELYLRNYLHSIGFQLRSNKQQKIEFVEGNKTRSIYIIDL